MTPIFNFLVSELCTKWYLLIDTVCLEGIGIFDCKIKKKSEMTSNHRNDFKFEFPALLPIQNGIH